jgi:hypothetical protein
VISSARIATSADLDLDKEMEIPDHLCSAEAVNFPSVLEHGLASTANLLRDAGLGKMQAN